MKFLSIFDAPAVVEPEASPLTSEGLGEFFVAASIVESEVSSSCCAGAT